MRVLVEAGWVAEPGGLRPGAAILVESGRIAAVDRRGALAELDVDLRLGGPDVLALPGLVNAHQHGRPDDTAALGVPDAPLECWLVSLLALPASDPYGDTRRLCRRLLGAGVTTAVHSHYSAARTPEDFDAELRALLAGYRDGGVRGIVAADLRDRGQPVYGDEAGFVRALPDALRARLDGLVQPLPPVEALLEVVAGLRGEIAAGRHGDVELIFGPPGPPWCSSALLARIARERAPVHTHLHETRYERDLGRREHGDGTLAELARIGLLDERLFVAHGVWLDGAEREALARAGTSVVTNPSSNLRLHAGVAPVRELLAAGVDVALGTDNMALGGSEEILDELRLLAALHRRPGIDEGGLAPAALLDIATAAGGRAAGRPDVGVLRPGACGDVLLVDLARLRPPGARVDPLALALAAAHGRDLQVVSAGRLVAHGEPVPQAVAAASDRAELAAALLPHVRTHFAGWEPTA